VRIQINGESRDIDAGITVEELLRALHIGDSPVAVERNKTIVPRAIHATTTLQEGDVLEIVRFVGGG
jgi:sulfur carrier protein